MFSCSTWLEHAKNYVQEMINHYDINKNSQVIEIASNDGYLLQYFKEKNIPVLGIEPAKNIAEFARQEKHISTINEFFGTDLANKLRSEGTTADLLLGNNVLAHVDAFVLLFTVLISKFLKSVFLLYTF